MKNLRFFACALLTMIPLIAMGQSSVIPLKISPESTIAGGIVAIEPDSGSSFIYEAPQLFTAKFDNNPVKILSASKFLVTLAVPLDATAGIHSIAVDVTDGPRGKVSIIITVSDNSHDTTINDSDPNPDTQYGDPVESGANPTGKERGTVVSNPSGGHANVPVIDCGLLHKIDGRFTDSISGRRQEWSGIIPQKGRFSNLYLDYCSKTKTLYLLNDWYLVTEAPDSNSCYNLFIFYTGGGAETWEVRVYHSMLKGIKVFRNGVDVSTDTNYVVGGKFGFAPSPLFPQPHTIYEFGVKVLPGSFYLPTLCDPVRPVGPKTICDESGNGLITDPTYYHGELGNNGVRIQREGRYIPLSGVAGLVVEPSTFGGNLQLDSSSLRIMGKPENLQPCGGSHVVDGVFTKFTNEQPEWSRSKPARGKYSNLYADYCDSILYILNDWVLGIEEPDKLNCYNLFELYTGDRKEHWAVYVYHSISKGIRVFLNGKDVSLDTSIVKGGKFGFDVSPLMPDKQHTIYEFAIKASEGNWNLQMCDPGPSSFCDNSKAPLPRALNAKITSQSLRNGGPANFVRASYYDTVMIVFSTEQNAREWAGNRYRARLNYDTTLFYPIEATVGSRKNIASEYRQISGSILQSGVYEVNAETVSGFSSAGDLFVVKGIALAGPDSLSTISGYFEVGNSMKYLRRTALEQLKIIAYSPNPITTGLVRNKVSVVKLLSVKHSTSSSDNLAISFLIANEAENTVKVGIYDVLGNIIYSENQSCYGDGLHQLNVTMPMTQPGLYWVQLEMLGATSSQPILIWK